jgi:mRNA-binding protein PUF3
MQNILDLCQNQYGNYVIQNIIEKQEIGKIISILEVLKGIIFEFSLHKYGSNVIEKLLIYGNARVRKEIINEVLTRDDINR